MIQHIVKDSEVYFRLFSSIKDVDYGSTAIEWVKTKLGTIGPAFVYRVSIGNEEDLLCQIGKIKSGKVPRSWVITPLSSPDNIEQLLKKHQFSCVSDHKEGMALKCSQYIHKENFDPKIEIQQIQSLADFNIWCRIANKTLLGNKDFLTTEKYGNWLAHKDLKFYMGYYNGEPAATAMTISSANSGSTSLQFVSTLAEYRKKGIATALCSDICNTVKSQGVEVITLIAENMAIPLYKKLGFKSYYEQKIYRYERN